jgi:DNA-binding NtrC family response regulator
MPISEGPVSVLVVDDDEPIRTALKKFLALRATRSPPPAAARALELLRRQKVAACCSTSGCRARAGSIWFRSSSTSSPASPS